MPTAAVIKPCQSPADKKGQRRLQPAICLLSQSTLATVERRDQDFENLSKSRNIAGSKQGCKEKSICNKLEQRASSAGGHEDVC